jgi:hypothetical protein
MWWHKAAEMTLDEGSQEAAWFLLYRHYLRVPNKKKRHEKRLQLLAAALGSDQAVGMVCNHFNNCSWCRHHISRASNNIAMTILLVWDDRLEDSFSFDRETRREYRKYSLPRMPIRIHDRKSQIIE